MFRDLPVGFFENGRMCPVWQTMPDFLVVKLPKFIHGKLKSKVFFSAGVCIIAVLTSHE
jgi:hypothetical protein